MLSFCKKNGKKGVEEKIIVSCCCYTTKRTEPRKLKQPHSRQNSGDPHEPLDHVHALELNLVFDMVEARQVRSQLRDRADSGGVVFCDRRAAEPLAEDFVSEPGVGWVEVCVEYGCADLAGDVELARGSVQG